MIVFPKKIQIAEQIFEIFYVFLLKFYKNQRENFYNCLSFWQNIESNIEKDQNKLS